MALVTVVGFPCSGKSRLAEALVESIKQRLEAPEYAGPKLEVVLVSDETSHVSRAVYDSKPSSAPRAALEAHIRQPVGKAWAGQPVHECHAASRPRQDRGVRQSQLHKGVPVPDVLCCAGSPREDSDCELADFGFRLLADAQVHVATPPDRCREWHEKRGECSYKPET